MYDASQIKVMTQLEAIRYRPAMWLRPHGSDDLTDLIGTAVSFFLGSHHDGRTTTIDVSIEGDTADAWVRIHGDGRGHGMLTENRFGDTALSFHFQAMAQIGPYQPGFLGEPSLCMGPLAAFAALSHELDVDVRDGQQRQRLRGGAGELWGQPQRLGLSTEDSMTIRYRADAALLDTEAYDFDAIRRTLAAVAALHPQLTLVFQGQRVGSGGGLAELHGPLARPSTPVRGESLTNDLYLAISLGWRLDDDQPSVRTFWQNGHWSDEALVEGFQEGVLNALRAHVRDDLPASDVRGGWGLGLDAVLHARIPKGAKRGCCSYEPLESATVRALARDTTHQALATRMFREPLFHAWLRGVFR